MATDDEAFDASVSTLDAGVFDLAAHEIAKAMQGGLGLTMHFQPGDATRYFVQVSAGRSVTVSAPDPDHPFAHVEHGVERLASVLVAFGVERQHQTFAWGHIDLLRPEHRWTAAVWRRLLAAIREELEES